MPSLRIAILLSVLLLAAACGSGDADESESWSTVFRNLPAALMSVWGTSADDIWAVGADPGDGLGPLAVHYDGVKWTELETGQEGDLWWVFGFSDGPVYMGGEGGLLLRYAGGAFERMEAPARATVYGIWGVAPDDLWAVGGNVTGGAFAWRFDGERWRAAAGFPEALTRSESMFKVWGRSNEDVWLVGTGGTVLHYDGSGFTQADSTTELNLFTAHGSDGVSAAVGGSGDGVILESEGSGWRDVTPGGTAHVMGVWLGGGQGYAVGVDGSVLRREAAGWRPVETGIELDEGLHAVWVDPEGGVWAVGGQVLAPPLINGVMVHRRP